MKQEKINNNLYQIWLYDWDDSHDDYLAGYVEIDPDADEDSDAGYWRFYANAQLAPMSARDLRNISDFLVDLNTRDIFNG